MLLSVRDFWADSNERRLIVVYSNRECAERFVKGQYETRAGNDVRSANMRCDERGIAIIGPQPDYAVIGRFPALYSYFTPIAVRLDEETIAVNPNRYSVSTSAHRSAIENALRDAGWEELVWTWKMPKAMGWHDPNEEWAFHKWVRKPLPELAPERREELGAAKKRTVERYRGAGGYADRVVKEIDQILAGERKDRTFYY